MSLPPDFRVRAFDGGPSLSLPCLAIALEMELVQDERKAFMKRLLSALDEAYECGVKAALDSRDGQYRPAPLRAVNYKSRRRYVGGRINPIEE